jgi:Ser-tRNA(Ala) deacylase AlaX
MAVEAALNALIAGDHPVGQRWITDEEMRGNMTLVRTMSVQPPMGSGRVRLVDVDGIDLQPCGGTHVARTGEIGRITLGKVELTNRRTLATDMSARSGRDLDYVGLFGADFMRELDAVITYSEKKIFLYQR